MTISVEAPPRSLYDVGPWLCTKHPDLMVLADRIGCVSNGVPDVLRVRDSVISFDSFMHDRQEFGRKNGLKGDAVSVTLGPQPSAATTAMMTMMPGDRARLRLLATLTPATYIGPGVAWCVDDLVLVTDHALLRDWLAAMAGYVHAP